MGKSILRFWLERGVDGFRVNVPSYLYTTGCVTSQTHVMDSASNQPWINGLTTPIYLRTVGCGLQHRRTSVVTFMTGPFYRQCSPSHCPVPQLCTTDKS